MTTQLVLLIAGLCALAVAPLGYLRQSHTDALIALRIAKFCRSPADALDALHTPLLGQKIPLISLINRQMTRAGFEQFQSATPPYVALVVVLATLGGVFIDFRLGLLIAASLLLAPVLYLDWLQRARIEQFVAGLPVVLERARQLVLIGNTFQQAFVKAAATADPVVRLYLDTIVTRIKHGASFCESVEALAAQIKVSELYMLSACVNANVQFGGRIGGSLTNLIAQLSTRRRLEREIKAATAETRVSAGVLIALTLGLVAYVGLSNPSYVEFFLTTPTGHMLLAGVLVWPAIGLLVMQRILRVDY